jgi:hypothetical protein
MKKSIAKIAGSGFASVGLALILACCGGSGTENSGSIAGAPYTLAVVREVHAGYDDSSLILAADTAFLVDGQTVPAPAGPFTLDAGEVALVTGTIVNPGTDSSGVPTGTIHASQVEISHPVIGTVETVDAPHARLVVDGLEVFLDGRTIIEAADGSWVNLTAIHAGDRVKVGGHPAPSGRIAATLVAIVQSSSASTVTGFVSNVDANLRTLNIGGLVVDFSAATLSGLPQVGDYLRIVGTRAAAAPLEASAIQYLPPQLTPHVSTYVNVFLHGVVTSVDDYTFAVDGLTVSPGNNMDCGPAVNMPSLNSIVQIDGHPAGDGPVIVNQWSSESPPTEFRLAVTGRVDAIDPAFGTLSALGFSIQPSFTTPVMLSGTGTYLTLGDVHAGDQIMARGGGGLDAQVLPDMLTRETSASTSVYAAYDLISFADPLVYVAGRPIATDANTQYAYIGRDADQTQLPMTHDLFFSNPHYFPYWDKICTPSINFVVHQNADGSLTAVSILWEPDYC